MESLGRPVVYAWLNPWDKDKGPVSHYGFHCPGCKCGHVFDIIQRHPGGPIWTFNGDLVKPTFTPSLVYERSLFTPRCHLFLKAGMIEFLNDCEHDLAGKTVPCPQVEED